MIKTTYISVSWLSGERVPQEIVQDVLMLAYEQMLYAPPKIRTGKWDKLLWNFEIQTDHSISARCLHLVIVNNEKREPAE